MTEKGKEDAIRLIEETGLNQDRVLVVYLPDCHESLAGSLQEESGKNIISRCLFLRKAETSVKGSGRSIEAIPCTRRW